MKGELHRIADDLDRERLVAELQAADLEALARRLDAEARMDSIDQTKGNQ